MPNCYRKLKQTSKKTKQTNKDIDDQKNTYWKKIGIFVFFESPARGKLPELKTKKWQKLQIL